MVFSLSWQAMVFQSELPGNGFQSELPGNGFQSELSGNGFLVWAVRQWFSVWAGRQWFSVWAVRQWFSVWAGRQWLREFEIHHFWVARDSKADFIIWINLHWHDFQQFSLIQTWKIFFLFGQIKILVILNFWSKQIPFSCLHWLKENKDELNPTTPHHHPTTRTQNKVAV